MTEPTWPTDEQVAEWRAELDRLIESGEVKLRTDEPPDVRDVGDSS